MQSKTEERDRLKLKTDTDDRPSSREEPEGRDSEMIDRRGEEDEGGNRENSRQSLLFFPKVSHLLCLLMFCCFLFFPSLCIRFLLRLLFFLPLQTPLSFFPVQFVLPFLPITGSFTETLREKETDSQFAFLLFRQQEVQKKEEDERERDAFNASSTESRSL